MAIYVDDAQRSWIATSADENDMLPAIEHSVGRWCNGSREFPDWGRIHCTRPRGHTGRHGVSDGDVIFAVWED